MFSAFKKLFGRSGADVMDAPSPLRPVAPALVARANSARPARLESSVRPAVMPGNAPAALSIPLKSILGRLPAEFMQRVRQLDVGEIEVKIPTQKVLSQIAQGAVKITYGELRQASPPGTFTAESDRDRALIEIPLHEILSRLDPSFLPRRSSQRHVSVPAEITGPFGNQAQVAFTTVPLKPAVPVQAPAPRVQAPAPVIVPFTPVRPVAPPPVPQRQPVVVPLQPAQPAQPAQPFQPFQATIAFAQAAPPIRPAAPQRPPEPLPVPQYQPTPPAPARAAGVFPAEMPIESDTEMDDILFKRVAPIAPPAPQPVYAPAPVVLQSPTPAPVYQPAYVPAPEPQPIIQFQQPVPIAFVPVAVPAPSLPITPIAPEPMAEPVPIRFNPAPPALVAQPSIAGETRFLTVSIGDLVRGWPEAVQQEITSLQLTTSCIGLPFGVIELAIKQGKVALPWRILRSWIKPPVFVASSPNDALVLELPLKIITPIFLAELRSSKPQKKVAVDDDIPDLFSNGKTPAPTAPAIPVIVPKPAVTASQPAPKPADTNYFAKLQAENQPEEVPPPVKKGPTPGTAFLVRYATPNEIVSKAAALDGVDGALIALPDGLLVANRIPASMNADTIAAFLPQIFGRVSQCTKELRLGDLNNLNFTVGNIPWKIFKVGAIYFAAFGRPGESLPTAQLAGIAAELDRKAK